jgi:hypothetical protein
VNGVTIAVNNRPISTMLAPLSDALKDINYDET